MPKVIAMCLLFVAMVVFVQIVFYLGSDLVSPYNTYFFALCFVVAIGLVLVITNIIIPSRPITPASLTTKILMGIFFFVVLAALAAKYMEFEASAFLAKLVYMLCVPALLSTFYDDYLHRQSQKTPPFIPPPPPLPPELTELEKAAQIADGERIVGFDTTPKRD